MAQSKTGLDLIGTCPETGENTVLQKSTEEDTNGMQIYECSRCNESLGTGKQVALNFREHVIEDI